MYKFPSCTRTCHLPLLQFMMAPRNKISFNDIRPQCVFGNNCNNIIIDAQVNRQPAATPQPPYTAKTGGTTPLFDGLSLLSAWWSPLNRDDDNNCSVAVPHMFQENWPGNQELHRQFAITEKGSVCW